MEEPCWPSLTERRRGAGLLSWREGGGRSLFAPLYCLPLARRRCIMERQPQRCSIVKHTLDCQGSSQLCVLFCLRLFVCFYNTTAAASASTAHQSPRVPSSHAINVIHDFFVIQNIFFHCFFFSTRRSVQHFLSVQATLRSSAALRHAGKTTRK